MRWPTLAARGRWNSTRSLPRARMTPLAHVARRPARLLEGDRSLREARRADGTPLGARRRPAGAPSRASNARQRLRLQVGDRGLAAVRSTPPRAAVSGLRSRDRSLARADEVDRGAALHQPEHGPGERVLRRRPHRRSHGRPLQGARPPRHLTNVGDDLQGDGQGREDDRPRAGSSLHPGRKRAPSGQPAADHRAAHRS